MSNKFFTGKLYLPLQQGYLQSVFFVFLSVGLFSCQTTDTHKLNSDSSALFIEGRYDEAEEMSRRALKSAKEKYGNRSSEVATILTTLGGILKEKARYQEAVQYLLEAIDIQKNVSDSNADELAYSYNNIAQVYIQQGELIQAKNHYSQAILLFRKKGGVELAATLNNISELELQSSDFDSARGHLKEAREILVVEDRDDDEQFVRLYSAVFSNYAMLMKLLGNLEEASTTLSKAIDYVEKKRGNEHPDYAILLNNLADVYMEFGNPLEAVNLYLKALPIMERSFGTEHPLLGVVLANWAKAVHDLGNTKEALALIKRALDIQETAHGQNSVQAATTRLFLSELYYEMGEYNQALKILTNALEVYRKVYGDTDLKVANMYINLGEVARRSARYDEAREHLYQAGSIISDLIGEKNIRMAAVLSNQANLDSRLVIIVMQSSYSIDQFHYQVNSLEVNTPL